MPIQKLYCCAAWAAAVLVLLVAIDCAAQEPVRDHSCTVSGAGIFAIPEGKDRDNFNHGGWGFQAGGGFALTRQRERDHGHTWYLTANYLYDKFRVRKSALTDAIAKESQLAAATSAHGDFSAVTLDPTFRLTLSRHSSLYWSGGFGWLHRGIGFNGVSMVPPLLPSSSSLGRFASNSGVFDFGMGLNYAPTSFRGVMIFVEPRVYHGTAINSGSSLVPISFGVRW
jgi:hypothetical protein